MGRLLNSEALQRPGNSGLKPRAASPAFNFNGPQPGGTAFAGPQDEPETVLQKFAFRAGLAMIFVRVTVLSELIAAFIHTNTYLLWIVGPPAIFGAIFTGGIGRTFRQRAAWMVLGFLLCVTVSLPFSSWKGGSAPLYKDYVETSFPLLFVVGGLTVVWRELRSVFLTIGVAGVFIIGAAHFLAAEQNGRLDMDTATTTIGNENDLASHLIFVLPFVLFIALDRRINRVIRLAMIAPIGYGLWIIAATASRGAMIALAACFLFALFWGSSKQRAAALIVCTLAVVSIPFFMGSGSNAMKRLDTLVGGQQQEEAQASEEARRYLLIQSLIYTEQHPLFGVGMGQFSNFEGGSAVSEGRVGNWHETHNAFTEVSSECGVPAFIFFTLSIIFSITSALRVYRRARREGYTEIANASFCYLLSMIGYVTSIVFLSNAYRYYLPLMIGLSIAMTASAERQMSRQSAANLANQPVVLPPPRPRRMVRA